MLFSPSISNLEKTQSLNTLFRSSEFFIQNLDKKYNFAIYHAFFLPLAYPIIKINEKGMKKRPIIASIRGVEMEQLVFEEWCSCIIKEVLNSINYVTSINKDSLNLARSIGNVNIRSVLIPNSIQGSSEFTWDIHKDNKGVIGTIGNFRKKKNIPLLIRSYSEINKEIRKKLLLVGDFKAEHIDEKRFVNLEISRNRIDNEVEFTGFVKHKKISEYLMQMNVFVICSINDGFPNTLLEAMQIGVPIVASNVGAMKDILTDGENALLFKSDDEEALTKAIQKILCCDYLAEKLSKGARELSKKFSISNERKQWLQIYRKLLN